MKRLLLPLLLTLVAVACNRTAAPTNVVLTPERALMIPRSEVRDITVDVTGRSTIYVLQNSRVRALIEWVKPGRGTVTIPLSALDDGSADRLFVGVLDGSIDQLDPTDKLRHKPCSKCMSPDPARAPCCPGK